MSFPYLAKTTLKYKSPHATDLSFAKDETIRVTGPSPDDEDWLIGETLDGSRSGGFPKDFTTPIEEEAAAAPPESDAEVPKPETTAAPVAPAAAIVPAQTSSDAVVPTEETVKEVAPALPPTEDLPPSPKPQPADLPPSTTTTATSTPVPATATLPPASKPVPSAAAAPEAKETGGDDEVDPSKMSLKDRLAFFNKAQAKAAPPPIKPKPAAGGLTWSQRQKLRQEQEAKEREEGGSTSEVPAAAPAAPAPSADIAAPAAPAPTPSAKADDDAKSSGLSAADAANSIGQGGSLKERMAALRAGGAFGAPQEKPAAPPKPSGKVWSRPAAPEPEPEEEGEGDETAERKVKSPLSEGGDGLDAAGEQQEGQEGGEDEEEESEEQKEKARRAAIAARMAKIGARGPMGMAAPAPPPKPTRKPTAQSIASPSEERSEPALDPEHAEAPKPIPAEEVPVKSDTVPEEPISSPPTSIAMPAIPRRTAPPRRKGPPSTAPAKPTPSTQEDPVDRTLTVEQTDEEGNVVPPPQVMVADEERPLPKTEEQLAQEKSRVEAGSGPDGVKGAQAAGIALAPSAPDNDGSSSVPPRANLDNSHSDAREADEDEDDDDLMKEASTGNLGVRPQEEIEETGGDNDSEIGSKPGLIGTVPLHPPADDTPDDFDDEEAPPPPPPRMMGLGKDEVELKHEHDAAGRAQPEEVATNEEDVENEDVPPPPPRSSARPVSTDRPLGPRPIPSPRQSHERALPTPPVGAVAPPRDDSEDERELESEGDVDPEAAGVEEDAEEEEDAPPPPPRRQPSMPAPLQTGLPAVPNDPAKSPVNAPRSPVATKSPVVTTSPIATKSEIPETTETADDDEKARKAGLAARMAKLGGIKFGMPPPVPAIKRDSANTSEAPMSPTRRTSTGPASPVAEKREMPSSPLEITAPLASPGAEAPAGSKSSEAPEEDEETPEAEAARRRATLARLRAGGSLGFGMFNHGPAQDADVAQDQRGIQEESAASPQARPDALREESGGAEEDEEAPPPPPGRPSVPSGRPMPAAQPAVQEEDEERDVPPPPPPGRPTRSATQDVPPVSPVRQPSVERPPVPINRQPSLPPTPTSPRHERQSSQSDFSHSFAQEPAVLMMNQQSPADTPPPPPSNRPPPLDRSALGSPGPGAGAQLGSPVVAEPLRSPGPGSHQRSMSTASHASRMSRQSTDQPAHRTPSRQDSTVPMSPVRQPSMDRSRQSFTQGRPGYNDLQAASKDSGARLARAARAMFDQGKKAYYGDGSPAGFVLVAMEGAHLARPQQAWGQVVYEQEASSVLKRADEPRPGDIAAFHDARLKGRKGIQSYEQHVGSVQEPLVGIVIGEFEVKNKHKLRVLQVERGVPEEVSYRFDDLKSGKVVVYRPGL